MTVSLRLVEVINFKSHRLHRGACVNLVLLTYLLVSPNKIIITIFICFIQTQEREAKENMKRKAKELQKQRQEATKYGRTPTTGFGSGGMGSNSGSMGRSSSDNLIESTTMDKPKPFTPPRLVHSHLPG